MSASRARPVEPGQPRLQLVPAIAPINPIEARPDVRYRVRAVIWGDHRRFEVRDTLTDTTLAIRATQRDAENEVIVLNIVGPGGGGHQPAPAPSPTSNSSVVDTARRLHPARTPTGTERAVKSNG